MRPGCLPGWGIMELWECGRAAVHVIMKERWLEDFRAELQRDVGNKGSTADTPEVFRHMRELVETFRIIKEEWSRRAAADKKQDRKLHHDARGCPAPAGERTPD